MSFHKHEGAVIGFELNPDPTDQQAVRFCHRFPRLYDEKRAAITIRPETKTIHLSSSDGSKDFAGKKNKLAGLLALFNDHQNKQFIFYRVRGGDGFGIILKEYEGRKNHKRRRQLTRKPTTQI
ncbi:MAG: hypothetical protein O2794_03615 [bacterium]|nr:hypothetical protein [bacterium]